MPAIDLDFWHWFVIALLLGIVEMLVPGAAFLWLGIAAGLVGLLLLLVPDLSTAAQFGTFAVLAVAIVIATRFIPKPALDETDQPNLNRRTGRMIGQVLLLESAIVNGRGHAHAGDTLWPVAGEDMPEGTKVRVVGAEGTLLRVEKV